MAMWVGKARWTRLIVVVSVVSPQPGVAAQCMIPESRDGRYDDIRS